MIEADEVEKLFLACLFQDGEPTDSYVLAEGISVKAGFHPQRIADAREQVRGWLLQLPDVFMKSSGAGMSFLQACETKDGEQWTGLHQRMDQLFMLGLACGLVKECMPRAMWSALPGGMPYYVVDDSPTPEEVRT